MDFYHYMMVVDRQCQHTFQYNQFEKCMYCLLLSLLTVFAESVFS